MTSDRRHGTRLPDDPAYWDALATRSVDAAFGAPDVWWRAISDGAYLLAASAALVMLGASLMLGDRPPRATVSAHALTELPMLTEPRRLTAALAPDDPMLATLLDGADGPPPASALLRLVALRVEGP